MRRRIIVFVLALAGALAAAVPVLASISDMS
jgi:hypothetical protein